MQNAGAAPATAVAAHLPPSRIREKASPLPPDQPQATGGHFVCFTPTSSVLLPQRHPAGRAAPRTCNHLPVGGWGKVAFSKRPRKVPEAAAPGLRVPEGQEVAAGKSVSAARVRYSPRQPPDTHFLGQSQAFSLAPPGRLRLPRSPAARGVATPRSRSAARGGVGELLGARTLRASASAASPPPPGAAVPGGGVARVRAAREEGVTARGGGGSRARLAAGRASALREVGVLGAAAAAARDGGG